MHVFTPRRLEEALAVLAERAPGLRPIAGATDLMVARRRGEAEPPAVMDILRLEELRGIYLDADEIDIGAACTFSEIRAHPLVVEHGPLIAAAAATVGAWQIQNRATLGGNIATASPAGDALPVLLVAGAKLVCRSATADRRLAYRDVHLGYRATALRADELIVRVRLPRTAPGSLHAFRKVGTRAAQAVSKVSVAFAAERDGRRLTRVRFAAGSVAPVPLRLRDSEELCEGARPTPALAERAAAAAREEVAPIDDVRSTAAYRRFVVGQLVRRMVLDAVAP